MIGELNASHTGVSMPPTRAMPSIATTRYLGIELDEAPGGRYKITVHGDGVSISARGQGLAGLDGDADAAGSTGTFAVGDSPMVALPPSLEYVQFGRPETATQGTKAGKP